MNKHCNYIVAHLLLALVGYASVTEADMLTLRGQSPLEGTLVRVTGEALIFETRVLGKVVAPLDEVQTLSFSDWRPVELASGERVTGRIETGERNHYLVVRGDFTRRQVELPEIAAIGSPVAVETGSSGPDASSRPLSEWELQVGVEAQYYEGTSDSVDPIARFFATRPGESVDFQGQLAFDFVPDEQFPEFLDASGRWRLELKDDYYGALEMEAERISPEGIGFRGWATVNAGKRLWEGERGWLEFEAGLGGGYTRWDYDGMLEARGIENRFELWPPRPASHDASETNVAVRLRVAYERDLFRRFTFFDSLTVYTGVDDIGDFAARHESAIQWPLSTQLRLRFDLRVDYENQPHWSELDSWRSRVGAGLMWDF